MARRLLFALNIFAFIFIGLQVRPIFAELSAADRNRYLVVAAAVLATVIVVRLAWHMSFNAAVRWRHRRFGFNPPRPMLRPSAGSGLVISWAGMRGVVTLAAALALPAQFPARDMIVLAAFSVVLGTLLIQGLTLKALLRALDLHDGDPVSAELDRARERVLQAALAAMPSDGSKAVDLVRTDIRVRLALRDDNAARPEKLAAYASAYRGAMRAARAALLEMRDRNEIGDDAFHALENDLDWMEVSDSSRPAGAGEARAAPAVDSSP